AGAFDDLGRRRLARGLRRRDRGGGRSRGDGLRRGGMGRQLRGAWRGFWRLVRQSVAGGKHCHRQNGGCLLRTPERNRHEILSPSRAIGACFRYSVKGLVRPSSDPAAPISVTLARWWDDSSA